MFHEPSLPASTWPMHEREPRSEAGSPNRVTCRERLGLAEEVGLLDVGDVGGARRQAAVGGRIELAGQDDRVVGHVWPCCPRSAWSRRRR